MKFLTTLAATLLLSASLINCVAVTPRPLLGWKSHLVLGALKAVGLYMPFIGLPHTYRKAFTAETPEDREQRLLFWSVAAGAVTIAHSSYSSFKAAYLDYTKKA